MTINTPIPFSPPPMHVQKLFSVSIFIGQPGASGVAISALSQNSVSWANTRCIVRTGGSADRMLTFAALTFIISAVIVEVMFIDTQPEGHQTQRDEKRRPREPLREGQESGRSGSKKEWAKPGGEF